MQGTYNFQTSVLAITRANNMADVEAVLPQQHEDGEHYEAGEHNEDGEIPQHYENERDVSLDYQAYGDVTEPFDYIGAETAIVEIIQRNIGLTYNLQTSSLHDAVVRNSICNTYGKWRGVTIEDLERIRRHVQVSRYDSFLNHVAIRGAVLLDVQQVEKLYAQCKPVIDLTTITAVEIQIRDAHIEKQLRDSFEKAEDLALEKFRVSQDVNIAYYHDLKNRNATWNERDCHGRWRNLFVVKLNPYMYESLLLSLDHCNMIANYLESKFRMP